MKLGSIQERLKAVRADERGAVTVDWVVLTAALIGLALPIISLVDGAIIVAARTVASALTGFVASLLP
ncbi:MAG: hypothetical protein AAGE18_11590 [Pseudomonadota bacterium]